MKWKLQIQPPKGGIHLSFGRASIKGNKRERTNLVADKNKCNVNLEKKIAWMGLELGQVAGLLQFQALNSMLPLQVLN